MTRSIRLVPSLLVLLLVLLLAGCGSSAPTGDTTFDSLKAGQRVYDTTDSSLTPAQTEALAQQIATLDDATGADTIVYVRAVDASSEDTFDQVEALQQAWVSATGADQDTAAAILVNRNPDDTKDARAGIFVGATYDDGNVPRGEQEAIVSDALVPPLRDGDVAASLAAGLDRLGSSIRNGPPPSALDPLARTLGAGTWLPWTLLGLALVGTVTSVALYGRRARPAEPEREPTTRRPGDLSPALVGALVAGRPQATAVPAVLLALAARDVVALEREESSSSEEMQVRLLDGGQVRDDIEQAVWDTLTDHAEGDVITSGELSKLDTGAVTGVVKDLSSRGWLSEDTRGPRRGLVGVAVVAVLMLAGALVLLTTGAVLLLVGAIPLGALALVGDEGAHVDLDAVLPDVVATGLGAKYRMPLERATEGGTVLRAFTVPGGSPLATNPALSWGAFSGAFAASSSSGGAGFSGAGAGSGGGAAGST